jgi:hypothetical protein
VVSPDPARICASVSTACAQKASELTICVRDLRPRHFSKAASIPRSTAVSGTPASSSFDERPIERGKQEQAVSRKPLKCPPLLKS